MVRLCLASPDDQQYTAPTAKKSQSSSIQPRWELFSNRRESTQSQWKSHSCARNWRSALSGSLSQAPNSYSKWRAPLELSSWSVRITKSDRMSVTSAFSTLIILGLLSVAVRSAPFSVRPNGTPGRHWETLYSRSLARNPWEKRDINRDGDYLMGIKRLRRLYCNVGIGFHIQVLPDGKITGVHNENRYSKYRPLMTTLLLTIEILHRCFCTVAIN